MMNTVIAVIVKIAVLLQIVGAFTWHLNDEVIYADSSLSFSEQYMYGSDGETASIFQGNAFIQSKMRVQAVLSKNISTTFVAFAAYDASRTHHESALLGLCAGQARLNITDSSNRWASEVVVEKFPLSHFVGSLESDTAAYDDDDYAAASNGSSLVYIYKTYIDHTYKVGRDGWYNIALKFCDGTYDDTVGGGGAWGAGRKAAELEEGEGTRRHLLQVPVAPTAARPMLLANSFLDSLTLHKQLVAPSTSSHESHPYKSTRRIQSSGGDGDYRSYLLVDGTVSFKNPYGYLPAGLFGVMPFQSGLLLGYIVVTIVFGVYLWQFQRTLIAMQYGVLIVLLFAVVETALWLSAYLYLNATGVPYCCPFPPVIVASLVLQIARQAISRALLLVVTLGYGIVRPRLYPMEWGAITFITVMYFLAATSAQVFDIEVMASLGRSDGGAADANSTLSVSVHATETVIDALFLTWIYLSLTSTLRVLREFRQTYKLSIYNRLSTTIVVFIAFFALITVLVMLDRLGVLAWPWQLQWLPLVLWPLLNFSILTSVSVICLPTERSRMLSYASQLPTFDPDAGSLDEFNDNVSSITSIGDNGGGRANHLGLYDDGDDNDCFDDDDDGFNAPHNKQRYDQMTPPNKLQQYRQLQEHQGTGASASKYSVRINPIVSRAGGGADVAGNGGVAGFGRGSRALARQDEFEHSIIDPKMADLSVDEREFEMIMRGEKPGDGNELEESKGKEGGNGSGYSDLPDAP